MNRFRDVTSTDLRAALQVCNRARNTENSVAPSRAQPESPDGAPEQLLAFGIQAALTSNLTRFEISIAGHANRI